MKLYELPRNTDFRLVGNTMVPPDAPSVHAGEVYHLHNIDGMYSYCTRKSDGGVVHVFAGAEVERV